MYSIKRLEHKMPALKAHQCKVQKQHHDTGGRLGEHQHFFSLVSNSNSDFKDDNISDSDSNKSDEPSCTDNSTGNPVKVDHLLPLYEVFRGLEEHGDIERRIKKVSSCIKESLHHS